MATLTSNVAISSTDLKYRGNLRDAPYTGSAVIRSIGSDCDGSMILYWEDGKLIGQFWSTTRNLELLSDVKKLIYSADKTTVTQDPTPIELKPGDYYVRFYPGSSAYYAHAAVRSSCGCGWCPEPCDRIWKVGGGSIQSIHEAENRLPEYDQWIPMAYYLGVYGDSYADAKAKGATSPIANNSKLFTSTPVKSPLKNIAGLAGASGGSGGGGSGTSTPFGYTSTPDGLEFLDLNGIDFCAEVSCDSDQTPIEKGDTVGPGKCVACGGTEVMPNKKPQSGDCGCSKN